MKDDGASRRNITTAAMAEMIKSMMMKGYGGDGNGRLGEATELFTCQPVRGRTFTPVVHLNAIAIDPLNPNLFVVAVSDEFTRLYDIRKYRYDASAAFGILRGGYRDAKASFLYFHLHVKQTSKFMSMSEASMEKKAYGITGNKDLNLKATELRLGLPGSESPEREAVNKNLVAGAKRGFSDTVKELPKQPALLEKKPQVSVNSNSQTSVPAPKQQVVGWPPIRSFRKNTMAVSHTKNEENGDPKMGSGCLYVKVSMDGAPYLRKVDLEIYSCYLDLSSALEKMFSCFTIGQYGSHGVPTRDGLSESRLMNLLHGSEYVLTYEDKDGDWMLVGDVPWDMFISSCKRMRIMKSSDAIGLAPRAMEKCRNRT
ncbi:hypothetical protein L1987_20410 [Smallanthus sonchifolius]|uniref:Uncharacterized protein n=1 Tax=Smallanthus sonchifolius TaxID=185202 RepID=A0ACB9IRC6_9ASTR|nr:hypothetical protein L1987_20410 [Smallanthus sonchifolius]